MLDNRKAALKRVVTLAAGVAIAGGTVFVGGAPANAALAYDGTLKITSLGITKGATTAANKILVTGKGFTISGVSTPANTTVNGVAATAITVISDTQMVVTTASAGNTAGAGYVIVTDGANDESDPTGKASKFTYIAPSGLTAITAATRASSAGGTKLTLAGVTAGASASAMSTEKLTVTVNGTAAKVTWKTSATVDAVLPAGTASATAVKVCVLLDSVYDPAASCDVANVKYSTVITKLSAHVGGVAGGTALTLTGKGFTGVTGVNFGGVAGTSFTNVSDTKITVTTPASTLAGDKDGAVAVTLAGMTPNYNSTSEAYFVYTVL